MPPKKKPLTNEIVVLTKVDGKTKIDVALRQIRELCRRHHLQTGQSSDSLSNQIYQDILFIYHLPRLCREGVLKIDAQRVGDGKFAEVSYSSLLSLKEPELINASFKRLWKELQRCELKELFKDFQILAYRETNDGKEAVASLVAKKP